MDYNREMPHRPSTAVLSDWKQRLWSSSQGNLMKPMTASRDSISAATSIGGGGGGGTKFSALVGGTISGPRGTVQRKAAATKAARLQTGGSGDFKVREIEASGKRSVSSLQGLQRDSEVMYVGTFSSTNADAGRRGKLTNVFSVDEEPEDANSDEGGGGSSTSTTRASGGTLSRSFSQPDFLAGGGTLNDEVSEEVMLQRPSGLFDRPMLGSLAFR